jgi:hypothetical protein
MRIKEQVIFDIKEDKFRYLHGEENKIKNRVSIETLNKRLNRIKRLNFYSNARMIAVTILTIIIFALINIKF